MSTAKNVGVAAFVALSALSIAGSGTGAVTQFENGEQINQSTFKGDWPATAQAGVLACDSSKGNAVTFAPNNSKTINAVDGPAVNWETKEGWPDAKEIWNGLNWGSFIDTGLKLCEKAQ
jgi:hypothetical protein